MSNPQSTPTQKFGNSANQNKDNKSQEEKRKEQAAMKHDAKEGGAGTPSGNSDKRN